MLTKAVGDRVVVNGNVSRIVKICEDNIHPTYLVVSEQEQNFFYLSENSMGDDNNSTRPMKRKAISISEKTSSASNWSMNEVHQFNIRFVCPTTTESKNVSFTTFFESSRSTNGKYESIINLRWDDDNLLKSPNVDSICKKLLQKAADFQILQSEASAENFVKDILDYIGISKIITKVPVQFGRADLVITCPVDAEFSAPQRMIGVVEVKGASPYSVELREKFRNQLATYMISLAIDNTLNSAADGDKIISQEIFGLLQVGLTPIFYRTEVNKDYVDAIMEFKRKGAGKVPVLAINEFRPVTMYNDREILKISSREIIFDSYEMFKNLLRNAKITIVKEMISQDERQEDALRSIEAQGPSPQYPIIEGETRPLTENVHGIQNETN